ncbi:MAG TPA: succinate dehydrogenase/fumarate reductase iron-sulfur subunit [Methanomassiliicoccales archaeon]|nr:succinate dehydrogenase/fumarate reductase iron-sulfur subunit [Methanomassiliicoccales archaeon]
MFLVVRRFDGKDTKYQRFEVKESAGMTILDALFDVRDKQDDSLAFRYSCRGAVCGSCAMLIDRVPRLACRTQVGDVLAGKARMVLDPFLQTDIVGYDSMAEILVEPMSNMPVQKDLAVDMTEFFKKYEELRPFLEAKVPIPEREYRMSKDAERELERYTNCILCGACYASCPVNAKNAAYTGPAALARLYRFGIDPRQNGEQKAFLRADKPEGWWACEFHNNCTRVCPKRVPPSVGIARARKQIQATKGKEVRK